MAKLTISTYAGKCGVSITQIHNRIKEGKIEFELIPVGNKEYKFIDDVLYPPVKKQPKGRKKVGDIL